MAILLVLLYTWSSLQSEGKQSRQKQGSSKSPPRSTLIAQEAASETSKGDAHDRGDMDIVVALQSIGVRERTRVFKESSCRQVSAIAAMTADQLSAVAVSGNLDTRGMKSELELRRFLEVAAQSEAASVRISWYWHEDPARVTLHDPACILAPSWIQYADSVAAQLEYHHQRKDDPSSSGLVNVDIEGRVTSSKQGGGKMFKLFSGDTGSVYCVD